MKTLILAIASFLWIHPALADCSGPPIVVPQVIADFDPFAVAIAKQISEIAERAGEECSGKSATSSEGFENTAQVEIPIKPKEIFDSLGR